MMEKFPPQVRRKIRKFGHYSPFHGHNRGHGNTIFRFEGPATTLQLHGYGIGDLMIIRQIGTAFEEYLSEIGDPELGKVVIGTGGHEEALNAEKGDVNLYWWWSMGDYDDNPGQYFVNYIDNVSVEPDLVMCLSDKCVNEVEQYGIDTLKLPLGVYSYCPLGLDREGIGYAGSKSHKLSNQEEIVLGPVNDRADFEWVDSLQTPSQLNLWYNTKKITFGMTKEGQRRWGMVNNRVFEAIGSGTPFIMESHWNIKNILGFDYPYQTNSKKETEELIKEIENNPEETLDSFSEMSSRVLSEHNYFERLNKIFSNL